jgi:hypothetical protein
VNAYIVVEHGVFGSLESTFSEEKSVLNILKCKGTHTHHNHNLVALQIGIYCTYQKLSFVNNGSLFQTLSTRLHNTHVYLAMLRTTIHRKRTTE